MAASPPQLPFYLWPYAGLGGEIPEEAFVSAGKDRLAADWGDYAHRIARYMVYWSHYEATVYRKVHAWADYYKRQSGIYQYTRPIYSPAYRIGEFWAGHIMGGTLDPGAGDGKARPSSLPVAIPESNPKADALRRAISAIWSWSNWQSHKGNFARQGAVLGDAFLVGVDDPIRKKVYIRTIDPRAVEQVVVDPWGNVKGYTIRERRADPRPADAGGTGKDVVYLEVATKAGESVHFQTYLLDERLGPDIDPEPFDWREYPDDRTPRVGPEWIEQYGFVPMVHVQHRDFGLGWGWSELHPSLPKLLEIDDQASLLGDQHRKELRPVWAYWGVAPPGSPEGGLEVVYPEATRSRPEPERDAVPAIYGPENGKAQPLVGSLDVAAALEHVRGLAEQIEKNHPELLADDVGPGDSGAARRIAREKVEALVVDRRAAYDDGLARMHQMCVSMAAKRGVPGFEAFTIESYARGELDHSIGERPVFSLSPMERLAESSARGDVLTKFVAAGVPLKYALIEAGYEPERVDEVMREADRDADRKAERAADQQRRAMAGEDGQDELIAGEQ